MKIQHLFCSEECEAVEDDYGMHIVYRAFRSPCLAVANEARTFALHTSDLFFQCMFTVDYLKQISYEEKQGYCKYEFREVLLGHFKKKAKDADESEITLAVCMVMQALAEWLIRSGSEYLPLAAILKEQMEASVSMRLNTLFRHGFQCVKEKEMADYMAGYMTSEEEWISEELEHLLYDEKDGAWKEPESTLRIAEGKKRSVVVALKAMIESDWVEDVNGGRPKNIEKAINEILRTAFGEKKKTALSQTVKPSNDLDPAGSMNRIAEELADKINGFASEKNKKR